MTDYRVVSKATIVFVALALITYDVLPFLSPPDDDTLSEVLRDWGVPAAYAWGFLAGHFWINGKRRLSHGAALVAGSVVGAVVTLASSQIGLPVAPAALVVGVIAGASLWPLERA